MKKKSSLVLMIFLLTTVLIFGWGDKGHQTIALFAMRQLPAEMKLSDQFKTEIMIHSVDPDNRKRDDKSEGPKHFIDIDYYKEFLDGKMITSFDTLINLYGEKNVGREGILPWATEQTFMKLIGAFKSKDKDKIILFMSDLAHYVGDGHQPLHASLNYNGQLTNQKGIHARYEIEMFDKYQNEITDRYESVKPKYIKNVRNYIFDYITEANDYVDMILSADKISSEKSGGSFNSDYYRMLWFKTKYITFTEINYAGQALASLIYTAWIDAGKPVLAD